MNPPVTLPLPLLPISSLTAPVSSEQKRRHHHLHALAAPPHPGHRGAPRSASSSQIDSPRLPRPPQQGEPLPFSSLAANRRLFPHLAAGPLLAAFPKSSALELSPDYPASDPPSPHLAERPELFPFPGDLLYAALAAPPRRALVAGPPPSPPRCADPSTRIPALRRTSGASPRPRASSGSPAPPAAPSPPSPARPGKPRRLGCFWPSSLPRGPNALAHETQPFSFSV